MDNQNQSPIDTHPVDVLNNQTTTLPPPPTPSLDNKQPKKKSSLKFVIAIISVLIVIIILAGGYFLLNLKHNKVIKTTTQTTESTSKTLTPIYSGVIPGTSIKVKYYDLASMATNSDQKAIIDIADQYCATFLTQKYPQVALPIGTVSTNTTKPFALTSDVYHQSGNYGYLDAICFYQDSGKQYVVSHSSLYKKDNNTWSYLSPYNSLGFCSASDGLAYSMVLPKCLDTTTNQFRKPKV